MTKYKGKLYKVLDNLKSFHGGKHVWTPGEWVKVKGELIPCQRGIHLCRGEDLINWLGPDIWAAEYRGDEFIIASDKVVVREARITTKYENWNECNARLLACYFAENVVHLCGENPLFEKAIKIARLFAIGEATIDELTEARNSAWNLSNYATLNDAAVQTVWAATNDCAAWYIAQLVAEVSVKAVAWDTLDWKSAKVSMEKWQSEKLLALLHK